LSLWTGRWFSCFSCFRHQTENRLSRTLYSRAIRSCVRVTRFTAAPR